MYTTRPYSSGNNEREFGVLYIFDVLHMPKDSR